MLIAVIVICFLQVHFFVATGGTGKQIYGTCLTIWEQRTLQSKKDTSKEEQKVFLPKCLVLLSTYPYLAAFREFLTQLYRLTKSGTMTLPIERYIVNFCAEIPAPPPGSFEVQTTMLDSHQDLVAAAQSTDCLGFHSLFLSI